MRRPGRFRLGKLRFAWRCPDPVAARLRLRHWYRSRLGRSLCASERMVLDKVLPDLFGYHLLQVGAPVDAELTGASRVSHCVVLDDTEPAAEKAAYRHCLYGEATSLPFASASLDVLLLPHTLEFEANPHQVLREADRTLVPEGHVVILGFNPWSLWGLRRVLAGWRKRVPWCGRFLTQARVKDWLALLGFDTVLARSYFYRPPFQHRGLMRRLRFMERAGRRWWPLLGGGYILVARKRVTTLTPVRPRWRSRSRLVPGRISQAGLRRQNESND